MLPDIFTDGHSNFFSTNFPQTYLTCRLKEAAFIEDIIGRQQHFILKSNEFAIFDDGSTIGKIFFTFVIMVAYRSNNCRYAISTLYYPLESIFHLFDKVGQQQ